MSDMDIEHPLKARRSRLTFDNRHIANTLSPPKLYTLTAAQIEGATPSPVAAGAVACGECCDVFVSKEAAKNHICRRYCDPQLMTDLGKQFYAWCEQNNFLDRKPTTGLLSDPAANPAP